MSLILGDAHISKNKMSLRLKWPAHLCLQVAGVLGEEGKL